MITLFLIITVLSFLALVATAACDESNGLMFFCIATFVLSAMAAVAVAIHHDIKENERLMAECMKDHKEYECASILEKPQQPVVPIIIPVIR